MLGISMRRFAAFTSLFCFFAGWALPANADCVDRWGNPRSGVRDRHTIRPGNTDNDHFVRTTSGAVTVQVDVQGAWSRYGACGRINEKLSFDLYANRKKDYVNCLRPSVQGPASFLSCWFIAKSRKITTWYAEITNPGACTVRYDLICWDGKQKP